jgi:hypothetical protein
MSLVCYAFWPGCGTLPRCRATGKVPASRPQQRGAGTCRSAPVYEHTFELSRVSALRRRYALICLSWENPVRYRGLVHALTTETKRVGHTCDRSACASPGLPRLATAWLTTARLNTESITVPYRSTMCQPDDQGGRRRDHQKYDQEPDCGTPTFDGIQIVSVNVGRNCWLSLRPGLTPHGL